VRVTKAKLGERLPYLLAKLKAPRVLERLEQTAERARAESWPYEQFLESLLEAEVFARDASGARTRIRHASFPALKTLEDFDWSAQPSAERPLVLHLAQLSWIEERSNVCFFGPPGTGKSHLAIALALKACERGYRVAFATAQEWVSRLEAAQDRNQLETELRRLERYHLLVVDEVGYLPLERAAPTCSSRSSHVATSAARSSSPPTAASSSSHRTPARADGKVLSPTCLSEGSALSFPFLFRRTDMEHRWSRAGATGGNRSQGSAKRGRVPRILQDSVRRLTDCIPLLRL